jgi:hypothetical protein
VLGRTIVLEPLPLSFCLPLFSMFNTLHDISPVLFCELPYALIPVVRKTGPWRNKTKQMRKQNTEDTQYKRDTDLHGSPSVGYIHQRNCQVLSLLLSNKMKGYNLQQNPL